MRVADHTGIVKSIQFTDDDDVGESYDRMKSSVFSIRRNTRSDDDDVTGGSREFHAQTAQRRLKRVITNR